MFATLSAEKYKRNAEKQNRKDGKKADKRKAQEDEINDMKDNGEVKKPKTEGEMEVEMEDDEARENRVETKSEMKYGVLKKQAKTKDLKEGNQEDDDNDKMPRELKKRSPSIAIKRRRKMTRRRILNRMVMNKKYKRSLS